MKASINTQTGLIIESQSDTASDATLIANAVALGIPAANVQIQAVTDAQLAVLIADRVPLADKISRAIITTYIDIDAIYKAAVGHRDEEYKLAEQDALAFKTAGYSGTCPVSVSSWKPSSTLTNQQKTDAIIASATAYRAAIPAMRTQRFASQDAMQGATTRAQLDAAVATWNAFIVTTRTSLGLP